MTLARIAPLLLVAVAAWFAWRRDFGWALLFTGIALGIIATSWVGVLGGLLCMMAGLVMLVRRQRRRQ
jgi:hypothetical protein